MSELFPHLDADALAAVGVDGWPFGMSDRVRFSELDPLNHVNNASYLSWFETVRIGYLLHYGLTGMSHTEADPQIVVRRQVVDYLAPVVFGDSYLVTMRTTRIKQSSLVMDYAVFVKGACRVTGETVIVSLTQDGKARQPFRAAAVDLMVSRDGAELVV